VDVVVIGVLGLLLGSFLNVVIYRLPRGESLIKPASRCPACEAPVKPYDNIPVLSWVLLRGRCRNCGATISSRYPLVEALTAAAFVGAALTRGVDDDLAVWLPFAAMLIAVAGIDLDHRIIPNKILLPAAIWGIAATIAFRPDNIDDSLIAGGIAFSALLLTALIYPAGMGMGDVKLAGVMGLYLGLSVIPALFVAFAAGAIVGVGIVIASGGDRKRGVPFGPFLALGAFVGLLAGPELIDLYSDRFLS
jgi:leader peptidase (prepilin peptidase) / N-methyltransferase